MATYVKPQALVFQEYTLAPAEITEPLRAHISGGNADLHRYTDATEKALINVGPYDRTSGGTYTWPDRTAGSLVDVDSVKLYIEDALLMYFEDVIGSDAGAYGLVLPVSSHKNWVRHDTVSFKSNGTSYPRNGLLLDRDVQIGDIAYVRGVSGVGDDCEEHELWSKVTGFAADEVDPTISVATMDSSNQGSTLAATSISQTDGPINCVTAAANGSAYDGLADGYTSETYTIEVVRSSVSGCNAARLRVTSDSGTDNEEDVTPAAFASATDIGSRGLTVTFDSTTGTCSSSADSEGIETEELTVGQTWEVTVTQAFERACVEEGTVYTGPYDDTYIIEVTKGGVWADLPEISVTTVKGQDSSGPSLVAATNTAVPVGSYGLTVQFKDCGNLSSSSSSISADINALGMGDDTLAGLRKGDKFYVTVLSGQNGPIQTLILRDDLPTDIQDSADLDLRLFIPKTVEVTENRISSPPLVNYTTELTQIVVNDGITAYDTSWTNNGVEQPLPVWGGLDSTTTNPDSYGIQYVEYREWLPTLATGVGFLDDVADIDQIPGPLDEQNPLKWAAFRALQNSNGTRVGYTAVTDPSSLEAWQDVLEQVKGRDDVYNFVPLTYDREVQNLFSAQVESESSAEAGNWKGMFVNAQAVTEKMLTGKSGADAQALTPTSTDGAVVLATLEDNAEATGTQYTLLSVPGNNAGFLRYGVAAGDVVRFLYSIDAFGTSTYREFIVDQVLSENSLVLLSGPAAAVTVAQKVEIWHTLTKNEIAADLVDQAQSFADKRVVTTWPDLVGTGGNTQDGIFLNAALAGLASGVVPQQGLTNVEIAGFDDLASRTRDYFTSDQLNTLAEGGIWIATEDRSGTPHTRHALTTDTTDLNRQEEMIRRNVDSISYLFLNRLRPFIGRTNATPAMLAKLQYEVEQVLKSLTGTVISNDIGPQLISGAIARDSDGKQILRIHPLAADRVEIVLDLVVPAPINHIELHLVV